MSEFYGIYPGHGPGPCPIDGSPMCTCKNPEQPDPVHVIGDGDFRYPNMSLVVAPEDILQPTGMPGTSVVLYRKGEPVREEDIEALGLAPAPSARAAIEPPADKAKRGPREKATASRDKALSETKEE